MTCIHKLKLQMYLQATVSEEKSHIFAVTSNIFNTTQPNIGLYIDSWLIIAWNSGLYPYNASLSFQRNAGEQWICLLHETDCCHDTSWRLRTAELQLLSSGKWILHLHLTTCQTTIMNQWHFLDQPLYSKPPWYQNGTFRAFSSCLFALNGTYNAPFHKMWYNSI